MDNHTYEISSWIPKHEPDDNQGIIIDVSEENTHNHTDYLVHEIPSHIDQVAAQNLIFMARDGHMGMMEENANGSQTADNGIIASLQEDFTETQLVTEEIITDDWVQHQGEDRVEIPVEQICGSISQITDQDVDVPLPTEQDEYTALRPYPCDFCSRRFRKKVSLMNHMVAHQDDRPHVCKLCGSRFFKRSDLINHLKAHAEMAGYEEPNNDYFQANRQSPKTDRFYEQGWQSDDMKPMKKSRTKRLPRTQDGNYTINESFDEDMHRKAINDQTHKDGSFALEEHNKAELRFPIMDENKPFVCQHCGLSFTREKAMVSHMKTHRSDSALECGICNEMFWDANALQEHQKSHQFEESNSEYEPELENESDSESEYKYGEYYCHQCGMSFHRQDLLRRHIKSHIKKEVYERDQHCCNTCGETFAEALDLLAHAEIHARYPPFKCVLCGESFIEEPTIKRHLTIVHSAEMTPNTCILCGKQCRDRKALMKHAWDHSREKSHSCSKCGKKFNNKARLKRHMTSHRDKSVICNVCKAEFPDGRSLSNHRHSHSANGGGKLFPCHECGKTFGSRSSQQIHVRIHTGERPYGCRYCWKAFADGGTLRKHERIHTGEKPYACSVCPRAFNQRVVLREHIRSHHSGLDSKLGTYYCTVCSSELASSSALVQHLIEHSDINTAMQRQPVTGPRKYKRRRKLQPHEINRLNVDDKNNNSSDLDISDFDMDNVDDLLGIPGAASNTPKHSRQVAAQSDSQNSSMSTVEREKLYVAEKLSNNWHSKLINSTSDDSYKSLLSNLENTLQSIDTLVVSNPASYETNTTTHSDPSEITAKVISPKTPKTPVARRKPAIALKTPSRPKMIHTEKTRIPLENGKRKTKLVTRTEPADLELFSQRPHTNDYEIISPDKYPPNKIQSSPVHIKQEIVCTSSELYDAQLLLEATSARREFEKYNPAIVNELDEILRSPDKAKSPKQRTTHERIDDDMKVEIMSPNDQNCHFVRRSTRPRRTVLNRKYVSYETRAPSGKAKVNLGKRKDTNRSNNSHPPSALPRPDCPSTSAPPARKQQFFECEMCSAVFPDRAQLLDHVPIHI